MSIVRFVKSLFHPIERFIKSCFCGLAAMTVQLILFNILRLYIHEVLANAIAIEVAIIINFFMNNRFSFHEFRLSKQDKLSQWLYKIGKFNTSALGSLILQLIVMYVGIKLFGSTLIIANLLLLIGIVLGSFSNYYCYRTFVWKAS